MALKTRKAVNKFMAALLSFSFLLTAPAYASAPTPPPQMRERMEQEQVYTGSRVQLVTPADKITDSMVSISDTSYYSYLSEHAEKPAPLRSIVTEGGNFINKDASNLIRLGFFEGEDNCLFWTGQQGEAVWKIAVPEEGFYEIALTYRMPDNQSRDFEFELTINDERPFDEAGQLLLRQVWRDAAEITRDKRGNDLRPPQQPVSMWQTASLEDTEGLTDGAYRFYFPDGEHELKMRCLRGEIALSRIILKNSPTLPSYNEYLLLNNNFTVSGNVLDYYEGEQALYKSDATLYPIYDRSSASTTPYDKAKIRLNAIGGQNWQYPGQYITWKINAPEDGLYNISFRVRQNIVLGMQTRRALLIDGEIPFGEAGCLTFSYKDAWVNYTPGDENGAYLFALTAGEHTLTLKNVMGKAARTMSVIRQNLYQLNRDYRKMLSITGPNPDRLQEYRLDQQIPSLLPSFTEAAASLRAEEEQIIAEGGDKGGETAVINRLIAVLEMCIKDPDTLPERLIDLEGSISALATYMLVIRTQTLEIDKFYLHSPEKKLPRAADGFWRALLHQWNMFIASFFEDFSVVDLTDDKDARVITVWIGGGRDQAQILKSMANDNFTPSGIEVNLMLVQTDLMTAIVSGNAPDVFVNAERGIPVDLAMRNSVAELSQLNGFGEVMDRFMPDAGLPYTYRGGVYAIPVAQMFHMMFYRTDIFNELEIEPPQTWEDLYKIIPVLQRRKMQIGLPYDAMRGASLAEAVNVSKAGMGIRNLFTTLLYQREQPLYAPDGLTTSFDQEESIEAFKQWCDFYTRYSLPLYYDFYNRFRTGMMPIGFQGYWMYNMLMVAAPEIRGMWKMAPIPGTLKPGGRIDRTEGAAGEGAIIIKNTRDLEGAWEFVKWWTDAPAQARFGMELEMLMGPAARYNTANLEAFSLLPWSSDEQAIILSQWEMVREVPVVAGGYYTARNVDNAFRRVVLYNENPRDMLLRFNRDINDEIARKRIEFP